MKELKTIICDPENPAKALKEITNGLEEKAWMQLLSKKDKKALIPKHILPIGSGVIIHSGGSLGKPNECLIPCSHLNQSAIASANWLQKQGLETKNCQIYNSLPLNHISGLMAWWRSCCWSSEYISIKPTTMRDPTSLNQRYGQLNGNPKITSLVPTQISRLLKEPAGIKWLQSFSVIWLGGALLPENLAKAARNLNIRLAPCYGATETTAMVAVQSPNDFLTSANNCSDILEDVELQLGENNRLKVKTARLAKAILVDGRFEQITNNDGWWESGDSAELIIDGHDKKLKILGRADTAINIGGETVYPEILQVALLNAAVTAKIPITEILLLGIDDEEWGQRIVALFRISNKNKNHNESQIVISLQNLFKNLPPHEKPISWYHCPELKTNSAGKWESNKWKIWLQENQELFHAY